MLLAVGCHARAPVQPGYLRGSGLMPGGQGRLNLTFRDVSDGVIDTSEFPRYRVDYSGPLGAAGTAGPAAAMGGLAACAMEGGA